MTVPADRVELLRTVRMFSTMPEDVLTVIAAALIEESFDPGTDIVVKGDPGDSVYLIAAGEACARDGDLVFNSLNAGDVFGEMAVLDLQPRSATVTTLAPTVVYRLDHPSLRSVMASYPDVALGIVQNLSRHLRNRVRERSEDHEYMRQFARVTAAAEALERGTYEPASLDEVVERTDALGKLARVFQRMAGEVMAREQQLQSEIRELRIAVDRSRQEQRVAEITGTDYFRRLQDMAASLRSEVDEDGDDQPSLRVGADETR